MEKEAVKTLLIVVSGMLIFLGIERLLQPFLENPLFIFAIGVALIIFAKRIPVKLGIVRAIGGILIFITLKPFVINFVSSAFIFIAAGVAGFMFLPKFTKFIDKFI